MKMNEKTVLFVCLGNICRSPAAEAVFKKIVISNGMKERYCVDSCGTGGGNKDWFIEGGWSFHEGELSDERMRKEADRRGIEITSRSRPLNREDVLGASVIIGMEEKNIKEIEKACRCWGDEYLDLAKEKCFLMTDFLSQRYKGVKAIPDPWYGGQAGFRNVFDLLEDASENLFSHLEKGNTTTD